LLNYTNKEINTHGNCTKNVYFRSLFVVKPMDTIKEQIRRIYYNAFTDHPSWNRRFFDLIYKADEGMLLTKSDKPVSCLLLQKYQFKFHGSLLPIAIHIGGGNRESTARQWIYE